MSGRRNKSYSDELKARVIYDYEVVGLSMPEIVEKYHLSTHTLIIKWIKKSKDTCKYPQKSVILQSKTKSALSPMEYSTPQEEIAALKSALEKSNQEKEQYRLQALAYSTLIDIAEEHGYKVRKNYGAKR